MRGGLCLLVFSLTVLFGPYYVLPSSFHIEQHPTIANFYGPIVVTCVLLALVGLIVVITASLGLLADLADKWKTRSARQQESDPGSQ